jgi:hypothetical protein
MADAQYLQESVGPALTAGLASCASAQPDDPVDYLAHWLLKYLAVQEKKARASDAEAVVMKERAELEATEQIKVDAEASKVLKLQAAKKAVEGCTNIPMFYEAIVKGVRENTTANNVYIALLKPVTGEEDSGDPEAPADHADENVEVWEEDAREPPAEGEEPLPEWVPPKILPMVPKYSKLQYVFASEGNQWLRNKELRSPACKAGKDASILGGGGTDTVSFQTVNSRGGKVIRNVLESDPHLLFFDMPMPGSFACQTLLRGESDKYLAGGVMGMLCCDTVDADGVLDDKDGLIFGELCATASVTYERLLMEAAERERAENELATKLLAEDIVFPAPDEGEEDTNPELCLAPEEGVDAEKDIATLTAEIETLSANLDKTNTDTGRIAKVKTVIKQHLPESKSNEHGREIPNLAVGEVDFEEGSVGQRIVQAIAKLVSTDTADLKDTAGNFATCIASYDIKTLSAETLEAVTNVLAEQPAIDDACYDQLPFQARLLYVLLVVVKQLSEPALRLGAKKKLKADKEAEEAAAAAAAEAEAKAAEETAAAAEAAAAEGGEAAETPP